MLEKWLSSATCKTNTLTILLHQMRISTTQVSLVMPRSKKLEIRKKKKCENCKSRWMKTKQSAMKLSEIRRRIKLCLREIILRFEMNLQNFLFSWQFNSYSYFKASTEVLSKWAAEACKFFEKCSNTSKKSHVHLQCVHNNYSRFEECQLKGVGGVDYTNYVSY
jgi:hypothetical protein